jgi:hypothetical protein
VIGDFCACLRISMSYLNELEWTGIFI